MLTFVLALAAAVPVLAILPQGGDPEAADARCLAAFAILTDNKTVPETAGQIGAIYFAGKILGRNPDADLAGIMLAADTAVRADLPGEATRCGQELQTSGARITEAGKQLDAQGK